MEVYSDRVFDNEMIRLDDSAFFQQAAREPGAP